MDYQRIYNELIEKARSESRVKVKGGPYYEAHHIIPKCLGGGGKVSEWRTHPNIILLTAGEHFYAHYYLTKIHSDNYKLSYAFWAMCNLANRSRDRDYLEVPDFVKLYEEAKKKHSKISSAAQKGRIFSEEHKTKIRQAREGQPGRSQSEETKARIRTTLKNRVFSEEHRAKISAAKKGKVRGPLPEEVIAKRTATRKLRREGIFLNKS